MKAFWTYFTLRYPKVLLYMLQYSRYDVHDYLRWYHRTSDFRKVIRRQQLVKTSKIWALAVTQLVIMLGFVIGVVYVFQYSPWFSLALIIAYPLSLAYLMIVPVYLGDVLIQQPRIRRMEEEAREIFDTHPGKKIAIAGSFGKTTAKEVLKDILGEQFKVAATPGNMNTVIGISRFAKTLDGTEEVLIFELGESHVGDIRRLCKMVQPNIGVITGINEAHLETFVKIENTVATIFELKDYLHDTNVYKNSESTLVKGAIAGKDHMIYNMKGANKWKVSNIKLSMLGTKFQLKKGKKQVRVSSQLVGQHLVGVLSVAVSIADDLGMTTKQIEAGLRTTKPFEHRMQPRRIHDAWVIDDTYNGNREGVEAGIKLLKNVRAKRKVYVTPGLVEQGEKTKEVHQRIGRLLANVVDVVVLMDNSVTGYIQDGLKSGRYKGVIQIEEDPLKFYTHIEHFVADGDVILMQNDWTDNYE